MSSISKIKRKVVALLRQSPKFGAARFDGAADDYAKLSPGIRSSIEAMTALTDESQQHNNSYRLELLKLVSLECAAGANAQRCRSWFSCMAGLASCHLPGGVMPVDPIDAVTYAALAGNFSKTAYDKWPTDLATQQIPARVLYVLMTGKELSIMIGKELFDNKYWLYLYSAITRKDTDDAQSAFIAIADWWLSEYRDSETPIYDPLLYPCFQPVPNAALALVKLREGMNIRFDMQKYKQFYVAALI